jgi:hypothetical protein
MPVNYIFWRKPVVHHMLKEPTGLVGRDLYKRAWKVQTAAKQQVGVKTGALKKSIGMRHERTYLGQKIIVGSPLSYALLHHEGSRPHVILPVRGQYLVFRTGGRLVFTTKVNHPGTRPNRYLSDNLYLALL